MNAYRLLVQWFGGLGANVIVILARAALIVAVVMLSDLGFTSFPYLQLGE